MTCKTNGDPCRCGAADGEERKLDALALLADRRGAVVERAQRALLTTLLETGLATVDDIRRLVELPGGVGPKVFGAVPLPLVRAGIIRADGFAKTRRPTAHARPVTVWTLADRAAAEKWLADHLDLPGPGDDGQGPRTQSLLFPLIPTNDTGAAVAAAAPGQEFLTP